MNNLQIFSLREGCLIKVENLGRLNWSIPPKILSSVDKCINLFHDTLKKRL